MSHSQIVLFAAILVLLIVLSGFFSAAETGLMAINRYRLRHRARLKKRSAMLILKLIQRPDRLLGMILIGNNFANIFASSLATLIAVHFFSETGAMICTVILAFIILVFAEVAPKTLAALYPDAVSKTVAWPVSILLTIFKPAVWSVNAVSNGLLRLFGVKLTGPVTESISREELRSLVYETSGRLSHEYQGMLLGILDLNKLTVDDVMIPQHEVAAIDLDLEWEEIQQQLALSPYDWLPVYRDNINQTIGMLHLRELMHASLQGNVKDKNALLRVLHDPYFVPEGTPLHVQLKNFQNERKRLALVVDEYGEILGLVTLEDILEEIVGEFTTNVSSTGKNIEVQSDGSYLVEGAMVIRDLNRVTGWNLPTDGPRTLNGLIIEYLESIPRAGICVRIAHHPIEILEVKENRVSMARVFPVLSVVEKE